MHDIESWHFLVEKEATLVNWWLRCECGYSLFESMLQEAERKVNGVNGGSSCTSSTWTLRSMPLPTCM